MVLFQVIVFEVRCFACMNEDESCKMCFFNKEYVYDIDDIDDRRWGYARGFNRDRCQVIAKSL